MAEIKIPLLKYVKEYFPQTPSSTARYWAEAGVKGRGPFAGKIEKILGRWYVCEYKDTNIEEILKNIDMEVRHE